MDLIKEEIVDFEELKLPEILYKYRSWSNPDHRAIITDQIVYLAAPFDFEDPMDCKLQKDYSLLTQEDIYQRYFSDSAKFHPGWTIQQHRKFERDWQRKTIMSHTDLVKKKQNEHLVEFNDLYGVLSLTTNPTSKVMWIKYGENHSGFCIGFNPKVLCRLIGAGGEVVYYDELPITHPKDPILLEFNKQVYSKEKKWNFEEEYRTYRIFPKPASVSDRRVKIPISSFKEIIFGSKMPELHKVEIKSICHSLGMKIVFKNAQVVDNEIILN
jgi:hypothetical protein